MTLAEHSELQNLAALVIKFMLAAAMAYLPEELIVEILVRLPAKALLRFRCLSEPSCAVIDSPHFIKSHLRTSSLNYNLGKLILSDISWKKFHVCDLNHNLEEEITPDSSLVGEVCGYCNGLLLLYRSKIGFSVYNPSTRQRRDLPHCPFQGKLGSGLGYDESIDDYKAVVIILDCKDVELQVWVCGLKSNIWTRLENLDFPDLLVGFGYFANGHLYWRCAAACYIQENENDFEVVAFDVSKEKFGFVPQPVLAKSLPILHVLEGCLCVNYFDGRTPIRADIYSMIKNDGVDTFTWTRLHSSEKPFKNVDALEHSKGKDKILLDIGRGWLSIVSYDPKKKSFVKVEMNKDHGWAAPILCVESLVPVGRGA